MFVVINRDGYIEMTNVFVEQYPQAEEAPDDIVFGDRYEKGKWIRCGYRPEPVILPPAELREAAYETMTHKENSSPLIEWEGKAVTVDQANKICLAYWIEGSSKAETIKALIITAREYIRRLYPDPVTLDPVKPAPKEVD